ncbi:MAG: AraC family transcriptional regulator [Clostridiales bacterium]|jgi:AraC-like DNA-binding protein|nr:AraC family transcriptional regulator [Clostridiales bacterium]
MILFEKHHSDDGDKIYNYFTESISQIANIHHSFEFVHVIEGRIEMRIDDREYTINEGHAALILPNQSHAYTANGRSKAYLCIFPSLLLQDLYEQTKKTASATPVFPFDAQDFAAVLTDKSSNPYQIKSQLYKIAALYYDGLTPISRNSKYSNIVSNVIVYIENHFTGNISLKNLAKDLGYDYHYLSGIIFNMLHINFLGLVNQYRINYAKQLLKDSEKTMTEIASLCGYNSIRSFNYNFLSLTGVAPKTYKSGTNLAADKDRK